MAQCSDPFDALLAGLERMLPQEPSMGGLLPYALFVHWTDIVLYGTPEDLRNFDASPDGQRVLAHYSRRAPQPGSDREER